MNNAEDFNKMNVSNTYTVSGLEDLAFGKESVMPTIDPSQREMRNQLAEAKRWLDEAIELLSQGTIDSLLRYFQTGVVDDIHLPSVVLKQDKEVHRMLGNKLKPIVDRLGLHLNNAELMRNGKLILEYVKGEYTLEFATIDPYKRTIVFHFDFVEMEREREIKLSKVSHTIKETIERFKDTNAYLENNTGLKKLKNKKTIQRLENNQKKIGDEIKKLEKEIIEIRKQKELLEDIKGKVPDMNYELRKFGFIFEFVKGEQYEI